jgi:two-component system LytT family sensor kinase
MMKRPHAEHSKVASNRLPPEVESLKGVLISPLKSWWSYFLIIFVAAQVFNLFLSTQAFMSFRGFIIATLWSATHCVTQSMGNGYVIYRISRKYSWLDNPWRKALADFIGVSLYSVSMFILVSLIFNWLWDGKLPENLTNFLYWNARFAIMVSCSIAFILTTIGFLRNWRESNLEAERLKTEMMTYKYDSLRNQVNPHFLFNSLNVLSDLVYEDQGQAVKFIRQLSDLYRYVLDSREREVVDLQEELTFIDSFIYLLKTRFEDKLEVNISITAGSDERIVPMALQILIENAVKHNEVSTQFPLKVDVSREGDFIRVTNVMRKIDVGEDSKKTGLQNIMSRYEVLSEQPVSIDETEGKFTVLLPFLKEEL